VVFSALQADLVSSPFLPPHLAGKKKKNPKKEISR